MKKAGIIIVCIMALLSLLGCRENQQTSTEAVNTKTVTVVNEVREADVWIIPDTEANRKTTVWGTATASKVTVGEKRAVQIAEPGDNGRYLFRMIDTESFYYSANEVTVEEGWTVRVKGDDLTGVTLEVEDENGALQATYEVFAARL